MKNSMCDLVDTAFNRLQDYVNERNAICHLRELSYITTSQRVDMGDSVLQALHILRYAWAQYYEYLNMFRTLNIRDVVSVDSRDMVDRLAFEETLKERNEEGWYYCRKELLWDIAPEEEVFHISRFGEAGTEMKLICLTDGEADMKSISDDRNQLVGVSAYSGRTADLFEKQLNGLKGCVVEKLYTNKGKRERLENSCREEIREYITSLNEKCVNYVNGHNCYGKCGPQLSINPVTETGTIICEAYRITWN